ncbi:MAG: response regulator transcription factor [Cyclobacteriaceae bacterium]
MRILTIEDEYTLLSSIQDYLLKEDYICDTASSYQQGLECLKEQPYDCVLLDITLPDGSGLKLLEEVKQLKKVPSVVIISAKNSTDDKVNGLDLGADDYLAKPFHLSELNARIKAVLRRNSPNPFKPLTLANANFNLESNLVSIDGQPVNLTKKEFDILFYLAENKERVVSKINLVEHLWGDKIVGEESFNFLFSHIKNIKKKLKEVRAELTIRTVYGWGYQLRVSKTTE